MSNRLGQVVIEVRGGNVVGVYSDTPLRIRLLDWDNVESDPPRRAVPADFAEPEPLPTWMIEEGL